MAQYNHLPIFQLGYKLTLEIYKTTQRFPREYKYSLGQRLKEISAEFLDYVVIANSLEDKMPAIKNAELRIERLKIHVRLAYDLKIISLGKYEEVFRSLEDLGKQLSGWKEWAGKSGGGSSCFSGFVSRLLHSAFAPLAMTSPYCHCEVLRSNPSPKQEKCNITFDDTYAWIASLRYAPFAMTEINRIAVLLLCNSR
ncbi:MAG: four helix bundle protein [Candidatus Pacebacteria bacterium]|nr:four helix bundle protein [Candidatus Paceibacterota bacterium]